jgi:uncharacterized membrane protein YuzA (DUF378 family)
MRPRNTLDWIAFVFLLIGAFSWGYFVTDVNILDVVLERIWDPLDDVVFILIALSGLYWLARVLMPDRTQPTGAGHDQDQSPAAGSAELR